MTPDGLRQRRERMGLTQSELALALGLRRKNNVSDWERGVQTPPPYLSLALDAIEYADAITRARKKRKA